MKKRVSFNIFALAMAALLAFSGIATAVPASIAVAASPDTPTLADIIAREAAQAIPVTVQGVRYYIVTLNRFIHPVTLEVSDDLPHRPLKVFVDADGNPVTNETTLRKIATIANARQLMRLLRGEGLIEAMIGDVEAILRHHKQIQFLEGVLDVLAAAPGIAISAYLTKGAALKAEAFEGAGDFLEDIITDPLNIVKGFVYADLADLKSQYKAALEIQRRQITDFDTARRYLSHLEKALLLRGPAVVALGKIDGLHKSDLERITAFASDALKGIGEALTGAGDFFAGLMGIVDEVVDINEKVTSVRSILDSLKGDFPWVATYFIVREENRLAMQALYQEILASIDNRHIQYTLSLAEEKLRKILVPDLWVSPVRLNPASVYPGESLSVTFTVRNLGDGPSGAFNNRISLARTKWGTDIFVKSINMDSLDAGASRQISVEIPIPRDIRVDDYYVTVFTDAFKSIAETNEMNNIGTSGDLTPPRLSILETPRIDLTVTSVVAPSNVQAGEAISIRFTVENRGTSPSGTFINEIYLAITPGGTLLPLGELVMDSLDANASKTATAEVTIPSEMPQGAYYVTVFADGHQAVTETVEGNNVGSTYPDGLSIGDPPPVEPEPARTVTEQILEIAQQIVKAVVEAVVAIIEHIIDWVLELFGEEPKEPVAPAPPTIPEERALTLAQKAANLAMEVANTPYLGDGKTWGGKGWNWNRTTGSWRNGRFVDYSEIREGYYVLGPEGRVQKRKGLDCSGLVYWAYNRAWEMMTGRQLNFWPAYYPNRIDIAPHPVFFAGAAGQWGDTMRLKRFTSRADLREGDLVFFEGHVAMYVGDGDVIHAVVWKDLGIREILIEPLDYVLRRLQLLGYGRVMLSDYTADQLIARLG